MKTPRLTGYQIAFSQKETRSEREVFIYGDSAGLKSLAKLLLFAAKVDQKKEPFPPEDSFHVHLTLPAAYKGHSARLTIGRADDKRGRKRFDVFPKPKKQKA
jgi:hypothetical protein